MSSWQRAKAWVKENPQDAAYYGFMGSIFAGTIALSIWVFKVSLDADKAEYESILDLARFEREQIAKGNLVLYTSNGMPVGIKPVRIEED